MLHACVLATELLLEEGVKPPWSFFQTQENNREHLVEDSQRS